MSKENKHRLVLLVEESIYKEFKKLAEEQNRTAGNLGTTLIKEYVNCNPYVIKQKKVKKTRLGTLQKILFFKPENQLVEANYKFYILEDSILKIGNIQTVNAKIGEGEYDRNGVIEQFRTGVEDASIIAQKQITIDENGNISLAEMDKLIQEKDEEER